jgi:hypothetical protein
MRNPCRLRIHAIASVLLLVGLVACAVESAETEAEEVDWPDASEPQGVGFTDYPGKGCPSVLLALEVGNPGGPGKPCWETSDCAFGGKCSERPNHCRNPGRCIDTLDQECTSTEDRGVGLFCQTEPSGAGLADSTWSGFCVPIWSDE